MNEKENMIEFVINKKRNFLVVSRLLKLKRKHNLN